MQVLVLNVQEELNPRFKFEKKVGEKLDWSFICEDESMAYQRKSVKAHKSVVVKYVPFFRNYIRNCKFFTQLMRFGDIFECF